MISWRDCVDPSPLHAPQALSEPAAPCLGVHKINYEDGSPRARTFSMQGYAFHVNYFMQASGQDQYILWLISKANVLLADSQPPRP
jgi:hypothetical protein